MDPNVHGQWARPSLRVFILKALNAAECEGLACQTSIHIAGMQIHNQCTIYWQNFWQLSSPSTTPNILPVIVYCHTRVAF